MKTSLIVTVLILNAHLAFCQTVVPDTTSNLTSRDSLKLNHQKDTIPYATFVFYRSYINPMNAPLKKVSIYINDSLIYKLKANTLASVKVAKEGKYRVAIDEKGESEISVKVKFGSEYFFRCQIVKGLWFGKPTIESVTPVVGRSESGILKTDDKKE